MNEFLAGMYQTREAIGASQDTSDVEKLAEAQLLDETLRAEGIDIDKLDGNTILKLAHQLLGDDSALVKAAAEEAGESAEHEAGESKDHEKGEDEETMEAKVAQADFLGRVMAHSYWNEKTAIEKTAGGAGEAIKKGLTRAGEAISSAAKAEGLRGGIAQMKDSKKVRAAGEAFKNLGKNVPKKSELYGAKAGERLGKATAMKSEGLKKALKGGAATAGLYGGGTAAVGGAGYALGHKKESAAIDILAEKRAMEWAEAHGIIGQSDEEKLAAVIDQRAAEMLAAAGIDVDAVEAGE